MPYFGGKAQDGVYQTIINQIPPHARYIEPFLGGGALLLKKQPAYDISIGVDLLRSVFPRFETISNLVLVRADALRYLEYIRRTPYNRGKDNRTFIYCDPPYPHATRGKTRYQYELSNAQHKKLLSSLKQMEWFVAISTYPNALYEKQLKNWRILSYSSVNRAGQKVEEWLCMNYCEPKILHDTSYLGKNACQRQSIKRRIQRMKKKILGWEASERMKLLKEVYTELPENEMSYLFTSKKA